MPRRDRDEFLRGGGGSNGGGDIIDDEEGIEYGERLTRRSISVQNRGSSSLRPAQILDQEVLFNVAERALERSFVLVQLLLSMYATYIRYHAIVARWQRYGSIAMEDAIAAVQSRMLNIRCAMKRLVLIMRWILCYGEMALLHVEDLLIFIRRRNRFQPKRNRTIDEIGNDDCYMWFGRNNNRELRLLFRHWRIPHTFRTPSRHVFQGEECFIIFLHHICTGKPFTYMAHDDFGGDPRDFSKMFDQMTYHLYYHFYNKISGTSLGQWIPSQLTICRRLIHNALADGAIWTTQYVNGEIVDEEWVFHHFDFDSFRPFGFLDDTDVPTARTGTAPRRRRNFAPDTQRALYSGYLRKHGLKAQVVWLPIGIIGSVFITEIRQNDNGAQNMSNLNNYLVRLLSGFLLANLLLPCLYCDGIFAILVTIVPRYVNPTPAQHLINMRMASLRECIEHVFADHATRFKLFNLPHNLHLFDRGVKIRQLSLVSFFILNCYYCIDGTRCRDFGHHTPSLETYLPLDEELTPPPAVNLGDVWDFTRRA